MASSDTHAIAAIAEVKAGYWYCDNQFPTPVADIPSEFFTHLFAAFADVNPSTYEVTFPEAYEVLFSTFTLAVQKKNPLVQTLLSIGGGASTFASMASQVNTRQSFIHSSINLARSNEFHGLSLHWKYPSTEEERTDLGSLLNEWRAEVDLESKLTGNDPLLLVAAVYYRPQIHGDAFNYPVDLIASSLDWINLVAYDFYNPALSGNNTGPFAALHNGHIHEEDPRCADPGVRAWIHHGVPANKIVFGLPFYGATWRLKDDTQRGIFAAADGLAAGLYINRSDGTTLYNQISAENTRIAYNDTQSITAKVKYAKENALLGYYAWHVGGEGTLSQAAFEAWDQFALATNGAGTGGAGTGGAGTAGAGTGGALTFGNVTVTGGAGDGNVTVTVTVGNINVGNITGGTGTGGMSTGGIGTGGSGTGITGTGTRTETGMALGPALAVRSINSLLSFRYQQNGN